MPPSELTINAPRPLREIPNVVDPRVLKRSWNPRGVTALLQQTSKGRALLKTLHHASRAANFKLFKADLRYKYTYDVNATPQLDYSNPQTKDWKETFCYGFYWEGTISLHETLNNFIAAWTLIHEGCHFHQVKRTADTPEEHLRIEYEAHVAEAEWLLQNPAWITQNLLGDSIYQRYIVEGEFLTKTKTGYKLNHEGIKQYIIRTYITAKNDPTYRYTKYAYEGATE